ncbi:MAG: MBL fold metallo-hydrolase [Limnochordaceae bacterium]|nr:MBL fold metallo-hydrolase [Limnochordaceae bacterium]
MRQGGLRRVFAVADGVDGIDLEFQGRHRAIASFVLRGEGGRFALIEVGPESTLGGLERGLQEAGLHLDGLEGVFVTHIHLDHAGAAGALAQKARCPVWVHEIGAPHLADPARLWESAGRVFGHDHMQALWGGITPIDRELLRPIGEYARIEILGHRLEAYHTPGHASHHVVYLLDGETLFTGDAAGVRVPEVPLVRAPAMPPELHVEQWSRTIDRMEGLRPRRLVLTHFGPYEHDVAWHLGQVRESLRTGADRILEQSRRGVAVEAMTEGLLELERERLATRGVESAAHAAILEHYDVIVPTPLMVNGYLRYWRKFHPELAASPS